MMALWVGLMPMPLQNATRCAEGIAMGMQQQKPARQISAWATLGCRPATRALLLVAARPCVGTAAMGAGFSSKVAGRIVTSTITA